MNALTIPFSTEALHANLLRLQNEWETVQASRDRDAIYQYLSRGFRNRHGMGKGGKGSRARLSGIARARAQVGKGARTVRRVILCTADPDKVDCRTRSKWSRVLRYAAEYKDLDEPLGDFIKRKGGINECAEQFARRGRGRAYRGVDAVTETDTSI